MDHQKDDDGAALTPEDEYNLRRWAASGWVAPTDEQLRERFDDAFGHLRHCMERLEKRFLR